MQNYFLPAQFNKEIPVLAGSTKTNSPNFEDGFNLALHIPDNAQKVLENRQKLAKNLNLENKNWLWLNQIHSDIVVSDEDYYLGISADAVISREEKNIPVVMTADCVPILLSSENGFERAAIHAGWGGIYKRIITKTIEKMKSSPEKIYAWIAPCAGKNKYEVDKQFFNKFLSLDRDLEPCFKNNRENHYLADLPAMVIKELKDLGVKNIVNSEICTISNPEFFSYRRDKEKAGRLASFISLRSERN